MSDGRKSFESSFASFSVHAYTKGFRPESGINETPYSVAIMNDWPLMVSPSRLEWPFLNSVSF